MIAAEKRRKGTLLHLICFAVSITILLAGLWPLQFHPENDARWIPDDNGIRFGRRGVVYSEQPIYGSQLPIQPGQPNSIELVIRPAEEPSNSISNILVFYNKSGQALTMLGQWKNSLVIRSYVSTSRLAKNYHETGARNILQKNVTRRVTIVQNANGTAIYADGKSVSMTPRFTLIPQKESGPATIILGNSPDGHSPWKGDILTLAFYDRSLTSAEISELNSVPHTNSGMIHDKSVRPVLSYSFDEHTGQVAHNRGDSRFGLLIPQVFRAIEKKRLTSPWGEHSLSPSFLSDTFFNILGFIPFGFFFSMLFRGRERLPPFIAYLGVAVLGCGVSLAIELTQAYLPGRYSSFADFVCNTLGTTIGIFLSVKCPDHVRSLFECQTDQKSENS